MVSDYAGITDTNRVAGLGSSGRWWSGKPLALHFSFVFAEAVDNNLVHCGELICGEPRYPCLYLGTSDAVIPTNPVIGLIQDIVSLLVKKSPNYQAAWWFWE